MVQPAAGLDTGGMETSQQRPENLRASDADRDRVAAVLGDALTEGRLTPEEHTERMGVVLNAKTLGELAEVTEDLPEAGQGVPGVHAESMYSSAAARELARSSQGRENIVAVFGGAQRKGRWLAEPRTNISLFCGGVELDFRDAVMAQREITVQCALMCGGVQLIVPRGVRVTNHVTSIMGGTSLNNADAVTGPNPPTIHLTGTCLMGGIHVEVKDPEPLP